MGLLVQWLRKEVRWLVIRSDVVDTDFFSLDVVPELVKFDIEVFRPRPILMDTSHLQGSAVVLEYMTVYTGLRCRDRIPSLFHFLQQLHHRDCISERIAKTGVFALC